MRKHSLLIGVAILILGVNTFVLGKVWYNQNNPLYSVVLTERELTLPYFTNDENSGVSLSFDVQVIRDSKSYNPLWLTPEKITSLGLTSNLSKEVFIAVEFDGSTYQQQLQKAELKYQHTLEDSTASAHQREQAEKQIKHVRNIQSRLYAIDAANSFDELEDKYSQQKNIFIAKGIVSANRIDASNKRDAEQTRKGYFEKLSVNSIFIPYPQNQQLKNLQYRGRYQAEEQARYQVELSYGANLEPVVGKVSLL